MEDYVVRQFGLILAEFTKVLGMQAENMQRQINGEKLLDESFFYACASNIESYVNDLR